MKASLMPKKSPRHVHSPMRPAEFAACLGLHRAGREWRGTCPACGYGSDAFTLSTWGERQAVALVRVVPGQQALAAVLQGLGPMRLPRGGMSAQPREGTPTARQKSPRGRPRHLGRCRAHYPDDPAGKYLARRGWHISPATVAALPR